MSENPIDAPSDERPSQSRRDGRAGLVHEYARRAFLALSDCNRTVFTARSEPELMQEVCRVAVERGGYRLAWMGLKRDDAEHSVVPVGHWGLDQGYAALAEISWDDSPRGSGPTGRAIRTGQVALSHDIATDPEHAPWREQALVRGFRSSIALPVRVDDQVVGALNLYAGEPEAFDADEVELLGLLADTLGWGITALRERSALAQSEERHRALLSAMPDMLFVLSRDGTYLDYMANQPKGLLVPPEQFIGKRLVDVLPDPPAAILAEACALAHDTGEMQVRDYVLDVAGRHGQFEARLVRSGPDRVFSVVREVTDEREAMRAHEEMLERYRSLFDRSQDVIYLHDLEGRFLDANPAALFLFGYTREEVRSLTLKDVLDESELAVAIANLEKLLRDGALHQPTIYHAKRRDGSRVELEVLSSLVMVGGQTVAAQGICRDLSERRKAEAKLAETESQLRQSQKLEAVGRLAGGIAHDFNNLLTVINAYAAISADQLGPQDPLRRDIDEIRKAGERAANLTRQLLAFSRKQILQPVVIDLNAVVKSIEGMLRRIIGEDIELVTALDPALGAVSADPGQIEQVIMTLAVNGRDAMPRGGRLLIATANVPAGGAPAQAPGPAHAGEMVSLSVTDTGHGMDAETQALVFEPFFTTKEPGKGTGLGLATVYGIVTQSGGTVGVSSQPGRGSTFTIRLPRVPEAPRAAQPPASEPVPLRGDETILLVEDEHSVRQLGQRILEEAGYHVLVAADGAEALQLVEGLQEPVTLVVTDVVMPRLGGIDLAQRLSERQPGLRVLFVSGYPNAAAGGDSGLDPGAPFIGKPFTATQLLRRVRAALDGEPFRSQS